MPPEALWDLVDDVPGALTEPVQAAARAAGAHVVYGTYERGPERGVVYNAAVVVGPTGEVLTRYRKTHPFGSERVECGGWVTSGDAAVVVDTPFARLGLMICFDGDYPELARIEAVQGAEVLCRPSALLRSADIWELTNRARAYDNHVFVVASNATGTDAAGAFYFGNSMIVTPVADVVARAASHECWVSSRLDPAGALASLTPGSSVPQAFDHLADRNLALLRRHRSELGAPAATTFPHASPVPEPPARP
jgi:predicted amidohydrolase